jgi:hypothetical protein
MVDGTVSGYISILSLFRLECSHKLYLDHREGLFDRRVNVLWCLLSSWGKGAYPMRELLLKPSVRFASIQVTPECYLSVNNNNNNYSKDLLNVDLICNFFLNRNKRGYWLFRSSLLLSSLLSRSTRDNIDIKRAKNKNLQTGF